MLPKPPGDLQIQIPCHPRCLAPSGGFPWGELTQQGVSQMRAQGAAWAADSSVSKALHSGLVFFWLMSQLDDFELIESSFS